MPSEERDRQFERALERHLRAETACPDAETLAAYHERTLSLKELTDWEGHINGCVRCQEILALVEQTSAVALIDAEEAEEQHKLLAAFSASRTNSELSESANPAAGPTAVRDIWSPQPSAVTRPRAWRWALPLGAVAAGLLVFVAIREKARQESAPQQSIQMAENRNAVPPVRATAPEQELVGSQVPLDKKIQPVLPKTATGQQAERKPNSPIPSDEMTANLDGAASSATANARAARPGLRAELDRALRANGKQVESYAKQSASPPQNDLNATAVMSDRTESGPVAPVAAPSARPAETSAAAAGVGGRTKKSGDTVSSSQAVGSASKSVEDQAEQKLVQPYSNYMQLRHVSATDPHVILAPGGKRAWRVGAAGGIEASIDSGITWKAQKSGVNVDLSAGSAPSPEVSWVVGRAGTILLTIDGGEHWKIIISPLKEDLGGVHAVDARHASIWNVGNQKNFETADGGMTWTAAANE
jgi:hypothetical protein